MPASEPAGLALMGVGLVGLGWIVSRRSVSFLVPAGLTCGGGHCVVQTGCRRLFTDGQDPHR